MAKKIILHLRGHEPTALNDLTQRGGRAPRVQAAWIKPDRTPLTASIPIQSDNPPVNGTPLLKKKRKEGKSCLQEFFPV